MGLFWYFIPVLTLSLSVQTTLGVSGVVQTVAGGGGAHKGAKEDCTDTAHSAMDGVGRKARFNYPWGIVFDPKGDFLYVADCGCPATVHSNDRIRKIDIKTGHVTTLAGGAQGFRDGVGLKAKFHHSAGMAIDPEKRMLYVADSGNGRIRKINLENARVTTLVGNGESGFVDGVGTHARLQNPQSLELDTHNNRMFFSDTDNHAIRIISLPDGEVTTLAGGKKGFDDGVGKKATFHHPTGLAFDHYTGILYVADHYNHVIRTVDVKDGTVETLAGSGRHGFKDGKGRDARLNNPEGMAFDSTHRKLYVVEFDGNAVRMITPDGVVSTLAGGYEGYKDGTRKSAKFFHPTGLTFNPQTKTIYVTDQYNHVIRSISGFGSDAVDPDQTVFGKMFQGGGDDNSSYLLTFVIISFLILLLAFACRPRLRRLGIRQR